MKYRVDRAQYEPGPASAAQVQKGGEKWTLILVRELRHSPEKVWQALTDPAQLREWAPFEADGNLGTVGSTVKLTWVGTGARSKPRVTRADAPEVLEFGDIRWELEAAWERHASDAVAQASIAASSRGAPRAGTSASTSSIGCSRVSRLAAIAGGDAMKFAGWQRLIGEYAKQFGVEAPGWQRRRIKSRESEVLRRSIELEQMDSADPPLAVHCVYGGRHHQRCRRGAGKVQRPSWA